jgi:hypothetical protein
MGSFIITTARFRVFIGDENARGAPALRGASAMAIYRILQNSPLGPEDLRRLTDAYELTLRALSEKDRNDHLAEFIAKKIIEIGQTAPQRGQVSADWSLTVAILSA